MAPLNLRQALEGKAHQCVLVGTTDLPDHKTLVAAEGTQTSVTVGTAPVVAVATTAAVAAERDATSVLAAAVPVTSIQLLGHLVATHSPLRSVPVVSRLLGQLGLQHRHV